jgi:hypothetical protein
MYKLYYGRELLYDPLTNDTVTDGKLTAKTNNPDYLDFTVPYGHALYGTIREQGETVSLYWGDTCLFVGSIESIETDIEGNKDVSCNGALSWLSDSVVRPYSTVAGEQANTAPSSVDGLFSWYIEQHNAHCLDSRKQFAVGANQGAALDANNYVYRSSEQLPETWAEIKSKLINSLGGYVTVDYRDPLTVNYYADVHDTNSQIIDFGVNITKFSKTVDTSDQYTAVRPEGATPEKEEGAEKDPDPITIEGLPDGGTSDPGITKSGDVVYSPAAVGRYGYRECAYSANDCETAEGLLAAAINKLNSLLSPALTIEVKAVDLALYMDGYDHLRVGQAVRVRSKLHDTDEYLMVNSISLDLDEPDNTTYTLGAEYSTLTGQQSGYLSSLNGSVNTALDTANALSGEVKQAAKDASAASGAAAAATTAAETATTAAGEAAAKAEEAKTAVDGKLDADVAEETYATKTALAETDSNVTKAQETADGAATDAVTAKTDAATASTAAGEAKEAATAAQETAEAATTAAASAQTTATAAQMTADAAKEEADGLKTLVRETSDGVEVGKSEDGEAYAGTHTLVGTDAFSVHDKDHVELATFSADKVELGKNSETATIDMLAGAVQLNTSKETDTEGLTFTSGFLSTSGADAVGIKADAGTTKPLQSAMAYATSGKGGTSSPGFTASCVYNGKSGKNTDVNTAVFTSSATDATSTVYMATSNGAYSGHAPQVRLTSSSSKGEVAVYGGTIAVNGLSRPMNDLSLAIRPRMWKFSRLPIISDFTYVDGLTGWTSLDKILATNQLGLDHSDLFDAPATGSCMTIKKAGYYHVKLQVFGTSTDRIGGGIFVGGTECSSTFSKSSSSQVAALAEHVFYATSGTEIAFKGWGDSGWKWRANGALTYASIDYLAS